MKNLREKPAKIRVYFYIKFASKNNSVFSPISSLSLSRFFTSFALFLSHDFVLTFASTQAHIPTITKSTLETQPHS